MNDLLLQYLGFLAWESAFQTPTQTPCFDCGHEYLEQDVETLQLHCSACLGVFSDDHAHLVGDTEKQNGE